MAEKDGTGGDGAEPTIIKKYANRRLYNTATSSYVTLDHLCQMVRDGEDFVVRDAKSGEDITHQVLTQIIVEQEAKGHNLLPLSFLRQLIRLYDDNLHAFVPRYLEHAMDTFARNQDQMRDQMNKAFGDMFPLGDFERMGRQNMALVQRAMEMFSPVAEAARDGESGGGARSAAGGGGDAARAKPEADPEDLAALRDQLEAVKAQLDALARKEPRDG